MIDCPGIVPPSQSDSDEQILMRGVVRVENVQNPAQYVAGVLRKCQRRHVERTYGVKGWEDAEEFLEVLARKSGRLVKGGEADVDAVARVVLNDFLRGRLPWFTAPPVPEGVEENNVTGEREGRLGEMARKRQREEVKAMVRKGVEKIEETNGGAIDPGMEKNFDLEVLDEDVEDGENEEVTSSENDKDGSDDEFEGFADGLAINPDAIGQLDGKSNVDREISDSEDDKNESSLEGGGVTLEKPLSDHDDEGIDDDPPGKRQRMQ